ncbi:protein cbp-1-like [Ostrinia furnacalis]|uniref:protein cbp-1-like n=1 Tax=Ostrinia furnacalis TaxID=93504 RepID=UPI00103E1CA0|nr:protein cbp-1-like [Ostrinia furnacalis]XP_028175928.1 protein cbp-1-like [Ostrinia furnacalis]XP_028175929.1 protein cbp-1-like [Ostrinia furnacalis]
MCPHKVEVVKDKFDLRSWQLVAQRQDLIERCLTSLGHSCRCVDAYCRQPSCPKMKRVVIHTTICRRKNKGTCPVCKQLIALCCHHARNCRENRCPVPFCTAVKNRLRTNTILRARAAVRQVLPADEEIDEIEVNIQSGVSGWRVVRVVSSPSRLEAQEGGAQAAVRQLNGAEAMEEDLADNNNVGDNPMDAMANKAPVDDDSESTMSE